MLELKVEAEVTRNEQRWNEQWQKNRDAVADREQMAEMRETNARVDERLSTITRILWGIGACIGIYVLQAMLSHVFQGVPK